MPESPQTPEQQSPNALEIVMFEPQYGDSGIRLGDALTIIGSIAAGYGAGQVIEAVAFPYNDEYEEHEYAIMTAQQDIRDIDGVGNELREGGADEAAAAVDAYQAELEALVAAETAQLPPEHNPTVETIAVWGGGILAAAAVLVVARRILSPMIQRYDTRRAASKKADNSSEVDESSTE